MVEALLNRQGSSLTVEELAKRLPPNWDEQRSSLEARLTLGNSS
jgi:hypothetical protein